MNSPGITASQQAGTWTRYTPGQRLLRFALYLIFVLAIVQSIRTIDVIPEFLLDAPTQMADLLNRMWPISWAMRNALLKSVPTSSYRIIPAWLS